MILLQLLGIFVILRICVDIYFHGYWDIYMMVMWP